MYHLELRQFPRNLCRYNLDERELSTILDPWVRDQRVELGERTWDPRQARITIIDGPRVPDEQLTMGRGWRHAQRHGQDVTREELEAARAEATQSGAPERAPPEEPLDFGGLLGAEPTRLLAAWRAASARMSGRAPSECLAQAERELAARRPAANTRGEGTASG